jgi:hypothetical protein
VEDNSLTLGQTIEHAIMGWFESNPGMPLAFVSAVDWIDSDGVATLTVAKFDNQPTHRSMGLVRYMDSWFDDDAMNEMAAAMVAAEEDEDD